MAQGRHHMDISSLTLSQPNPVTDDVFTAAALPVEEKKAIEALPVELKDSYELPRQKVSENEPVLLREVDEESQTETGGAAVAPVGLLMTKLNNGEAEILEGSTTDMLKIEVDGKVYFIVGRFAELMVDGALQVNGFFGHYAGSYHFAGRGVIRLDDGSEEQLLNIDLDGQPLSKQA